MADNPELKGREAAKNLSNEVFYNDMECTFDIILNTDESNINMIGFLVKYLEASLITRAKLLENDDGETASFFSRGLKETVKLLTLSPRKAYSFFKKLMSGPAYDIQYC